MVQEPIEHESNTTGQTKIASVVKHKTKLSLGDVLRILVNDGRLDKTQAEKLYKDRKQDSSNLHPVV